MSPEEIQQIFFVECEESLAAAESGLADLRAGTRDAETINAVFRAIHSIKGGAGAFGFGALQAYTHTFETLLSDVRDGTVPIVEPLVDLLLRALDTLSDHVSAARDGDTPPADASLLAELDGARTGVQPFAPVPVLDEVEVPVEPVSAVDDDLGMGLEDMLADLLDGPAVQSPEHGAERDEPAAAPSWQFHLRSHGAAMTNGSEPLAGIRELVALGGLCTTCDTARVPTLENFQVGEGYLDWTFALPATVDAAAAREIFEFNSAEFDIAIGEAALPPVAAPRPAQAATPATALPVAQARPQAPVPTDTGTSAAAPPLAGVATGPGAAGQSIRIDLAKLDRLIDSVGELVIAQAMMAQRLSSEGMAAGEELSLLETLTRDIQENAMSIRAQPIGSVFSRVPRILRELAASTGKHVRLEVIGETTELDKTVIERLGEPLTHLIRNAVDHGIENAEERIAAGKNPEGTLTLSAEQRSGRIRIRIADDGKGIDCERVLAKAIEKGLVAPDAQLSREEIENLIFAPGFSTAATVSNVSGRGVGMDVVRQNVKDLGGRITIETEPGRGTSFILTLPLTLAISDGMIISVGDQTLVVPLAHVVESLRPDSAHVQAMGVDRQMLNVRGQFIPVIPVGKAIGATGCYADPERGVLIVVDSEVAGQAALLVDDITDQRQFVIKSLDANYRSVSGVAGATILGDGRVALILDVDGLVGAVLRGPERLAA
ncbi:MAG TPA: chemotaxis protein CheA [Novosphingobium sp.]|nr:chemotaxis protein CheA [Novosphingobium sp.]